MKNSFKILALAALAILTVAGSKPAADTAPYERSECTISFSCTADLLEVADVNLLVTDFSGKTSSYAVRTASQNFIVETASSKLPAAISFKFDVSAKSGEYKKDSYALGLNYNFTVYAYGSDGKVLKKHPASDNETTTVRKEFVSAILPTFGSIHDCTLTVTQTESGSITITDD